MNKEDDPKYLALRLEYLEACRLYKIFAPEQAKDGNWLKTVTDHNLLEIIKLRMEIRRRGLRAINEIILIYHLYCDEMGYR